MPRDVVVISLHEKGFWQADLYRDASELTNDEWEGAAPDTFLTRKKGGDMQDAINHACGFWPDAEIRIAQDDEDDEDPFKGDNLALIEAAGALLKLDAEGALAPHGIGGHARTIIKSFMLRLPVTDLSCDPWIQADA